MAGTGTAHLRPAADTLLRVEDLVVEFPAGRQKVHAVSGVSLDIRKGETLGLVGESGCGKSTTGKAVIQLPAPTSGRVRFDGQDLTGLSGKRLRQVRTRLQLIFQDPISSLNPRRKVRDILAEPLRIWGRGSRKEQEAKVRETLDAVGLDPDVALDKRPHQFSGGQCQRISIARALVMEPDLIICDEPVSALDVSVQAQILNLLDDLKARYDLTLVFIAHDLAVVRHVSTRVAVMYLGKICEVGDPDALYARPAHPYTAALLASIPVPDPDVRPDDADLLTRRPAVAGRPALGCRFRTRCPRARTGARPRSRPIRQVGADQYVACHFPLTDCDPAVATPPVRCPVGGVHRREGVVGAGDLDLGGRRGGRRGTAPAPAGRPRSGRWGPCPWPGPRRSPARPAPRPAPLTRRTIIGAIRRTIGHRTASMSGRSRGPWPLARRTSSWWMNHSFVLSSGRRPGRRHGTAGGPDRRRSTRDA